uniref:Shedu anti-phage system protein SduA domain-containing protein n=1 Tax=Paractinoplanes polyasparticus TaxID=2856853 RepID=UPI001C85270F|nr:Shedu anti-phage system protein SduA domain-containing protein [Actinoplanes polyasparticus]
MNVKYETIGGELYAHARSDGSGAPSQGLDENIWLTRCAAHLNIGLNRMRASKAKESELHRFLERHAPLVPGAAGPDGAGHHGPRAFNYLLTEPELDGYTAEFGPDFMWVRTDSGTLYVALVEIERPSKSWFNPSNGTPTGALTQALDQLASWRTTLNEPINQLTFLKKFDLDTVRKEKNIKFEYWLVYGHSDEFLPGGPHGPKGDFLNRKRKMMARPDEHFRSLNSMTPESRATDALTIRYGSHHKLEVKALQPTFSTGPRIAPDISRLSNLHAAVRLLQEDVEGISGTGLPKDRVDYLLGRLDYWSKAHAEAIACGAKWLSTTPDTE